MKSWGQLITAAGRRFDKTFQKLLEWRWLSYATAVILPLFTIGSLAEIYANVDWLRSLREPIPPSHSQFPQLDLGPLMTLLFGMLVPIMGSVVAAQKLKPRSARTAFGLGCILLLIAYVVIFLKLGFVAPFTLLDGVIQGLVVGVVLTTILGAIQIMREKREERFVKGVAA